MSTLKWRPGLQGKRRQVIRYVFRNLSFDTKQNIFTALRPILRSKYRNRVGEANFKFLQTKTKFTADAKKIVIHRT